MVSVGLSAQRAWLDGMGSAWLGTAVVSCGLLIFIALAYLRPRAHLAHPLLDPCPGRDRYRPGVCHGAPAWRGDGHGGIAGHLRQCAARAFVFAHRCAGPGFARWRIVAGPELYGERPRGSQRGSDRAADFRAHDRHIEAQPRHHCSADIAGHRIPKAGIGRITSYRSPGRSSARHHPADAGNVRILGLCRRHRGVTESPRISDDNVQACISKRADVLPVRAFHVPARSEAADPFAHMGDVDTPQGCTINRKEVWAYRQPGRLSMPAVHFSRPVRVIAPGHVLPGALRIVSSDDTSPLVSTDVDLEKSARWLLLGSRVSRFHHVAPTTKHTHGGSQAA